VNNMGLASKLLDTVETQAYEETTKRQVNSLFLINFSLILDRFTSYPHACGYLIHKISFFDKIPNTQN
jgi:hypothetical protein